MTYPIQFRKKIMKLHETGMKYEEIERKYLVSIRTLARWKKEIIPKSKRNKPWKKINKEALIEDIKKYPDSYGYERAERLCASRTGIQDAMKRLSVTYKKNTRSSESGSRKKIYVLSKN
jgi:transposase